MCLSNPFRQAARRYRTDGEIRAAEAANETEAARKVQLQREAAEARALADVLDRQADRRTRDRLRRSQHLTGGLHVDHLTKRADCRLWLADFVAGAYIGGELYAEAEPWEVIGAAHMIEVITLP